MLVPQILQILEYVAYVAKKTHRSIDFNTGSVSSLALWL